MNKTLSLAVLIIGVLLLIAGVAASDSAASGVSRFFTGNPTDKTLWLMLGGIAAVAVGGGGLLSGRKAD